MASIRKGAWHVPRAFVFMGVNCILYLVDTYDLANFRASLASIPTILRKYDIVAYHESSLPEQVKNELSAQYPRLNFFLVNLDRSAYPADIECRIPETFTMDICSFSMGYRAMCKFFSGQVFDREELAGYEYVLRLDTDSAFLEDLTQDPFEVMKESSADYGYRLLCNDHPQCYVDYYSSLRNALEKLGHEYSFPKSEEGFVYFSNFEIYRMSAFRTKQHRDVYEELERTGGFFIHRWGDHIHRYAYIRQFDLPVHQFVFGYRHGGTDFIKGETELMCF